MLTFQNFAQQPQQQFAQQGQFQAQQQQFQPQTQPFTPQQYVQPQQQFQQVAPQVDLSALLVPAPMQQTQQFQPQQQFQHVAPQQQFQQAQFVQPQQFQQQFVQQPQQQQFVHQNVQFQQPFPQAQQQVHIQPQPAAPRQQQVIFFLSEAHQTTGFLSNWAFTPFVGTSSGEHFIAVEQYMMHKKALIMGDLDTEEKIMQIKLTSEDQGNRDLIHNTMKQIKDLGRTIKNFSEEKWNNSKIDTVRTALIYKFAQNKDILLRLMQTKDDFLVEASPYDKVWGIGLSEADAQKTPIDQWGQNLLGKLLMDVRKMFKTQGIPQWSIEIPVRAFKQIEAPAAQIQTIALVTVTAPVEVVIPVTEVVVAPVVSESTVVATMTIEEEQKKSLTREDVIAITTPSVLEQIKEQIQEIIPEVVVVIPVEDVKKEEAVVPVVVATETLVPQ